MREPRFTDGGTVSKERSAQRDALGSAFYELGIPMNDAHGEVIELDLSQWPTPINSEIVVCHARLEGEPASKTRARFAVTKNGKVRTYNTRAAEMAQDSVGWAIRAALTTYEPDKDSAFGVRASFASGVLIRRDVDNMLKLVMDAATGLVWADDSQVMEVHARLCRDAASPYTEMLFYRTGVVAKRTIPCLGCGKEMLTYRSWRSQRRYCSATCRQTGRKGEVIACANCERPVYVPPHRLERTKYCSPHCKTAKTTVMLRCAHCRRTFSRPRSQATAIRSYCNRGCHDASKRSETGVSVRVERLR